MSAFQVSPNHIGAIVRWYLKDCPDWMRLSGLSGFEEQDAEDLMAMLAFECYRSVRYRYPDGKLPGPIEFPDSPVVCDPRLSIYKKLTPIQVIKACDCLSYQSCEHPEWETSKAKRLLHHILGCAIARIDGYDKADWAIEGVA